MIKLSMADSAAERIRTVGFIFDNNNLWMCMQKAFDDGLIDSNRIDYNKFVKFFARGDHVLFKYVFLMGEDKMLPLRTVLQSADFELISKPLKWVRVTQGNGEKKAKNNFDVEITIKVMKLIHLNKLPDRLVFVTGDSSFVPLIEELHAAGCNVEAVCTEEGMSHLIEDMLRKDYLKGSPQKFFYIEDIWDEIKLKNSDTLHPRMRVI